jgi:tetratricopeptide (TPR) repeat protein
MDSPSPSAERNPDELLRDADRARDSRDWALAEMLYAGFLARRPDAWGIRVQQGHCRKEQGDPAGALDLYRQAEAEATEDADLQLQIGHALKLLDRPEEAEVAYARAVQLDPGFAPARQELVAIRRFLSGRRVDPASASASGEAGQDRALLRTEALGAPKFTCSGADAETNAASDLSQGPPIPSARGSAIVVAPSPDISIPGVDAVNAQLVAIRLRLADLVSAIETLDKMIPKAPTRH